jgi:hypothetical protein
MSLRSLFRLMAFLVITLLSLPGSAWAQVALSGQVRFADGSIAAGVTVQAESVSDNLWYQATTDSAGRYLLQFAPGTYDVSVGFDWPGFSGSQILAAARTLNSNTTLDLVTGDIVLNGRVLNSSGQPVANVRMSGSR